jgi:3-hydroxyacyl-CoA dehydrogenase/enoyl-CoA hydratase/3-hydroxybutyryl-CoA epimerase
MESIDKAMRHFGMPVGPFELLDDVGIDVATKGAETLSAAWPTRMPIDAAFSKMVTSGRLGRKSKKGFYVYEGEKRVGPDTTAYTDVGLAVPSGPKATPEEIEARLLSPMVNEAAFCLAEGVVESPAKLDLAMIFGTGFPPFRGGLLKYADTRGLAAIVSDLSRFEKALGPRFTPAPNLALLAQKGETFHKES